MGKLEDAKEKAKQAQLDRIKNRVADLAAKPDNFSSASKRKDTHTDSASSTRGKKTKAAIDVIDLATSPESTEHQMVGNALPRKRKSLMQEAMDKAKKKAANSKTTPPKAVDEIKVSAKPQTVEEIAMELAAKKKKLGEKGLMKAKKEMEKHPDDSSIASEDEESSEEDVPSTPPGKKPTEIFSTPATSKPLARKVKSLLGFNKIQAAKFMTPKEANKNVLGSNDEIRNRVKTPHHINLRYERNETPKEKIQTPEKEEEPEENIVEAHEDKSEEVSLSIGSRLKKSLTFTLIIYVVGLILLFFLDFLNSHKAVKQLPFQPILHLASGSELSRSFNDLPLLLGTDKTQDNEIELNQLENADQISVSDLFSTPTELLVRDFDVEAEKVVFWKQQFLRLSEETQKMLLEQKVKDLATQVSQMNANIQWLKRAGAGYALVSLLGGWFIGPLVL